VSKHHFPVSFHPDRSQHGAELDISLPESTGTVLVSQDVFGEQIEHMQLILFPAGKEWMEDGIAVRFNPDGSFAEVSVPDRVPIYRTSRSHRTAWEIARDGQ
jgi:hypothetical protein